MLKRTEIVAPSATIQRLLAAVGRIEGIASVQFQASGSSIPPGDVLKIDALAGAHMELMHLLADEIRTEDPGTSISVTELRAFINPTVRCALRSEESYCSWEEMQSTIAKQSNMTATMVVILIVSGLLAGIGITNGAVHLVIAAMVVAPGFEPIVRVPLDLISEAPIGREGSSIR